ncbi:hypothetical protein LJC16_03210 [Bacteroidales bacterium OttesenSCG-928-C19]|nr:hypothetical protein [Bacteroidales bacterium OttesenSCG-928-C19]
MKITLVGILCISLFSCSEIDTKSLRADMFIAHAGGEIDDYPYTNSLEALNFSYEKGCRLFELDIMQTSDGKFVAVHTWEDFKEMTGYEVESDETPLSEKEFLSKRMYGQYTPLNMAMINKWFEGHADAILVTDKINTPQLFAKQFHFKDRLIMELFSWEAVDEAIEAGITPMLNYRLLFLVEDMKKALSDRKIKHIAIARSAILDNEELLTEFKEQGIKVYVYGLNWFHDEEFLMERESEYIYGIYVDEFDFLQELDSFCLTDAK